MTDQRPEIIFVDIGLPGMDGYEVARSIRERFGDSIVLIALTGYGQQEELLRTFDAGFDHHLTKPVDPDALYSLIAYGPGKDDSAVAIGPVLTSA